MKKILALVFCAALGLTACETGKQSNVSANDLQRHRYEIMTMNGQPIVGQSDSVAEIRFDSNMQVSGKACNRFFGKGVLNNGVLTVPAAGSTRMFCAETDLNTLENMLFEMFEKGSNISIEKDSLTLSDSTNTLVFKQRDLLD